MSPRVIYNPFHVRGDFEQIAIDALDMATELRELVALYASLLGALTKVRYNTLD